jgi:hypothetical protein
LEAPKVSGKADASSPWPKDNAGASEKQARSLDRPAISLDRKPIELRAALRQIADSKCHLAPSKGPG